MDLNKNVNPMTDEEIEEIIESLYKEKSDYTKDFIRKSIKRFGDNFWFYKTNRVDNNLTKVIITCKIHGDFGIDPQYFLKSKYCYGCPKCHPGYTTKMDLEMFGERLHKVFPHYVFTENSEYKRNNINIELKCTKHNIIFKSRPDNLLYGKAGCSECVMFSKGEKLISDWFIENNIIFSSQFSIPIFAIRTDNTKLHFNRKNNIRVDFYLKLDNREIIIEYNGSQHYIYCDLFHPTENIFLRQIARDIKLNNYCKDNNIEIYNIPYKINTKSKISPILTNIINNKPIIIDIPEYQFPRGYSMKDVYRLIEEDRRLYEG